jgi:hypothetical protein
MPPGMAFTGLTLSPENGRRLVAPRATLDHLTTDLKPHLPDDADDVPQGGVALGPHDEIRPSQSVEMGAVVRDEEDVVLELAQELGC